MEQLIIIKTADVEKIRLFLDREHINYEIYQEPIKKFKKARPARVDIFADYGEAIKDKELEVEKSLLEEDYDEENVGF